VWVLWGLLLPVAGGAGCVVLSGMQQLVGLTGLQRLQLHNCMKIQGGMISFHQ